MSSSSHLILVVSAGVKGTRRAENAMRVNVNEGSLEDLENSRAT